MLAGLVCGLALLVRPNLLPLALVAGFFVILDIPSPNPRQSAQIPNPRRRIAVAAAFGLAAAPFALLVLWLNNGFTAAHSVPATVSSDTSSACPHSQ